MEIEPLRLCRFVYDRVLADGVVPSLADIAEFFGISRESAAERVRQAGLGKTLMPDPTTGELWMVGPFSAKPTSYRLEAAGKTWFANCAWDAFGVHALVGGEGRLTTVCEDCQSIIELTLPTPAGPLGDYVVHFLVPARDWYRDIGFT